MAVDATATDVEPIDVAAADGAPGDRGARDSAAPDAGNPDHQAGDDAWSDAARPEVGPDDRALQDVHVSDEGPGTDRRDGAIADAAGPDNSQQSDAARPDTIQPPPDAATSCQITRDLGSHRFGCGVQAHATEIWDLTLGDLTLQFEFDGTGAIDDSSAARTWGQLGVRQVGAADSSPTAGTGVWFATDVEWRAGTLDPDPASAPTFDIDDRLMLQKQSGVAEGGYDLPGSAIEYGDNHYFWFDRDGVDQWQAENPNNVDRANYNTGGIYQVVITLHATDATHGTAYMTVNGLVQGFEVDGDWNTIELTPAGMTWSGDMTQLQVFYGLTCQVVASTIAFNSITVTGCLAN